MLVFAVNFSPTNLQHTNRCGNPDRSRTPFAPCWKTTRHVFSAAHAGETKRGKESELDKFATTIQLSDGMRQRAWGACRGSSRRLKTQAGSVSRGSSDTDSPYNLVPNVFLPGPAKNDRRRAADIIPPKSGEGDEPTRCASMSRKVVQQLPPREPRPRSPEAAILLTRTSESSSQETPCSRPRAPQP